MSKIKRFQRIGDDTTVESVEEPEGTLAGYLIRKEQACICHVIYLTQKEFESLMNFAIELEFPNELDEFKKHFDTQRKNP